MIHHRAVAIQFARARYISRSTGGSAVRSAAYNARDAIEAERTGEVYYFRHRDAPEHHEVLLPEGTAERFRESGALWNAAEAAERRKDAQVAREIVLALPADREVTTEDRIALARSFAEQHFVAKGLAVQLDVHSPHPEPGRAGADSESERANWHAHLLITTRRLEGEGFAAKKARDLDPEVRSAGGRARVADGAAWGEFWREHQDRYFREHGLEARVDPLATHAQEHIGPVRMRRAGAEIVERAEAIRQANEAAARDPGQVLAALTRNNATFTERDVMRFLTRRLGSEAEAEIAEVRAAVLREDSVVPLFDRETGAASARFTTREVRAQEQAALAGANRLAHSYCNPVAGYAADEALEARRLRPDQLAAFTRATGGGRLKLIEGRAGTGKSYTLAAIRDAHERDGMRVVGLAPTNAVAQDLAHDGFREARTVHAALFALKNGRTSWDKRTVVVVDEAAMLDTRVTGELLTAAWNSGAKLILAGDDRQLASIERGGLFAELRQRHVVAEITEVTRQKVDWQRQAARDLAEGRFADAVGAFDQAGAITWTGTQAEARSALVEAWTRDAEAHPGASRFVFAYTNRDVDALNAELRQVRRERGELASPDVPFETKHGMAGFAVGDRVQFTETQRVGRIDKQLRIYNGNAGTITAIDPFTGTLTARLDGPAGKPGRVVAWSAADFQGFRHGYAGTIYKGQGKTLDRTYLYHTEHWRGAASYVALTRQRESAAVFVARETAGGVKELARQMARGEVRAASVAWATWEELAQTQQRAPGREYAAAREAGGVPEPARSERQGQNATPDVSSAPGQPAKANGYWAQLAGEIERERDPLKAKVQDALERRRQQAAAQPVTEWLIPPHFSRDGRDSLGRGLDPASIAAAVASDARVKNASDEPWQYLERAYRNPRSAGARLNELVEAEGWTGAAARIAAEPARLGRLHGREWLFAGRFAQLDRISAISAARSVSDSLVRTAGAERQAERAYRDSVTTQLARDQVGVPKLSEEAIAVLEAVRAAIGGERRPGESSYGAQTRTRAAVARAWEAGRRNPAVAAEIDRFQQAAEQRLGEDGVRTMLRSAREGAPLSVPGVGPERRQAVRQMARDLAAAGRGRDDHEEHQTLEAFKQREAQQEHSRPRERHRGMER